MKRISANVAVGVGLVLALSAVACEGEIGEAKAPANAPSDAKAGVKDPSSLSSPSASLRSGASPQKASVVPLACPNLESQADLATLFGIDASLAARLDRVIALADELQKSVNALDTSAREACTTIGRDLNAGMGPPAGDKSHPCDFALTQLDAFRKKLAQGSRGASLKVRVDGVTCGISKQEIARCAGECLTGQPDVESAIDCTQAPITFDSTQASSAALAALGDTACTGRFFLPYASSSCNAKCGARALRSLKCAAKVDVKVDGGFDPSIAPAIESLKRDLPAIASMATELVPRAERLAKDVSSVVDDTAVGIDTLTAKNDRKDRLVVVGAMVAACFAPKLAETVRAGVALKDTMSRAASFNAALVAGK